MISSPKETDKAITLRMTVDLCVNLSVIRPNTIEPIISPGPRPSMQRRALVVFSYFNSSSTSSIESTIIVMRLAAYIPTFKAVRATIGNKVIMRLLATILNVSMMSCFTLCYAS